MSSPEFDRQPITGLHVRQAILGASPFCLKLRVTNTRGPMASQGDLAVTFKRAAVRFRVAESDYLLLGSLGIASANSFAFRVPKSEDLEGFLQEKILPAAAYKGEDGVLMVFDREPTHLWRNWKLSEDAAALRRLWQFSRELAKGEVERLATGEDTAKKLGLSEVAAMEEAAVARGMPRPLSDSDRPSLFTLVKVSKALQPPAATYDMVVWESYFSRDEEEKLIRQGKLPKTNQAEIVLTKDMKLEAKETSTERAMTAVSTMERLRAVLDLRAKTFEYLGIASYGVMNKLNVVYFSKLNEAVPEGMRQPTLNEVRRFDREIMKEICRFLSRGQGSMEAGVDHYSNRQDEALWQLLRPVPKSLPDQGVDAGATTSLGADKDAARERASKRPISPEKPPAPKRLVRCLMCGKKHEPLCHMPEDFRRKQREKARRAKAAAKPHAKGKGGGKKHEESSK